MLLRVPPPHPHPVTLSHTHRCGGELTFFSSVAGSYATWVAAGASCGEVWVGGEVVAP